MNMKRGIIMKNFQTVTSAATSIRQIPALVKSDLFAKLVNSAFVNSGVEPSIMNFGAGKYPEMTAQYLTDRFPGVDVHAYDPYNLPDAVNADALKKTGYDIVFSANVLNVINSDDALTEAIVKMAAYVRIYGRIVIGVYEGDKSGVGRMSGADTYQRNLRTAEYLPLIRNVLKMQGFGFFYVEKCGKYIVLTRKA